MSKKTFPPRLAKTVHGGLRPQGGRREAWWRRRWMEWLESLHMGARLGRGRNYAQLGQIRALTVLPGEIWAEVQGAEQSPYSVFIGMEPLNEDAVTRLLKERPFLTAQLVAHALPVAFEEALHAIGFSLFPGRREEMRFQCDCKDWARPCKHLAAALCLFADAIGADPLLLLRFRGIVFPESQPDLTPQCMPETKILSIPLSVDAASVPRRLGTLPYWRGAEDFQRTLGTAYLRAHDRALLALTETIDLRFPEDHVTD